MSHSHHKGRDCHHCNASPDIARKDRYGSRLEDGDAHEADHARWSRRNFLARLGVASVGTAFLMNGNPITAFGRTPLLGAINMADTDRVVILIQLNGGNDGLNTVIPVNNDIYYNRRPTIAIQKAQSILLQDDTGLHPAMATLQPTWDDGRMAVVHNVGYPSQTRSHFEGTVNWATARDQGSAESSGWLGRYLVENNPDIFSNPADYPLAVRVGGPATLFQSAAGNLSVTFGDAQDFERFIDQGGFYDADDVPATIYGSELSFVRNVTNASFRYVESVQNASNNGSNLAEYPGGGLSNSLAVIARMLRGGLATSLYTVSQGGFDTHSNQGGVQGGHAGLLSSVATSVAAFLDDLAQDGLEDRVLVMTFSEFGRTLNENGSGGTDHGAGAPMMIFGKGVAGGLYGTQSNLLDLYGGDPLYTTDYRDAYWTILEDWFGLPDNNVVDVLGSTYNNLGFVGDAINVGTEAVGVPVDAKLYPNYPNPFRAATSVEFELAATQNVRLSVFDIRGRHVKTLLDGTRRAGRHTTQFEAAGRLPSGNYIVRLETKGGSLSQQMTFVR